MHTPTPHNAAAADSVAKTVLMFADASLPESIAKKYLADPVCFSQVRNISGFTGLYKGKKVSLMGSGIGMPSMGIYSYELFNFYGVQNIISLGFAHKLQKDLKPNDIIVAMGACTDSNYGSSFDLPGIFAPTAGYGLLKKAVNGLKHRGLNFKTGNVVSVDVFYPDDGEKIMRWSKMGVLAWDMETAALYMNAARAGKNALYMAAISDEKETSEERESILKDLIDIAVEISQEG
jgi:purine-nucleoside phosphorylase